jgi:hypothetical protein
LKFFRIIFLLLIFSLQINAQNSYSFLFNPVYQSWNIADSSNFNEITNLFSLSYSAWRNTTFNLITRYSAAGGDTKVLKGLSDTQLSFGYKIPAYNLSFEGGISIPTGKSKLSPEEYQTSVLISQNIFGMQTANFGQGMNYFVGAGYTVPVSEEFVIGGGLSYQVRSEYQPLEIDSLIYSPSDELTAAAGFDLKMSETSSLTADITGMFYGSDKMNGRKVFSAGTRIILNLNFRKFIRFDTFTANFSYRNSGVDKLESLPVPQESDKLNPAQLYFDVRYSQYVTSFLNMNYSIFLTSYEKTILYYSGYKLFGAGLFPEFKLSPSFKIPVRLKIATGSADDKPGLTSYEIGIGFLYMM